MSTNSYTKNVDGLSDEQKRLYEIKNAALIQDAVTEGMLKVPIHKALRNYADPVFARENVSFVEHHQLDVEILCQRGTQREASFCFTGPIWQTGVMPFVTSRQLHRPEPWAPHGTQYIVIATAGLDEGRRVKEAFHNIHTMASLRKRRNGLKDLREFTVGGEETICLSLPFSTNPEHVLPHEKVLPGLPNALDPQGVAGAFIQRRGHVVTERNILDVWLAEPTKEAGKYRTDPVLPEILRQGHVVRVEVVFRIVPAGNDFALRIDLKSIVIVNTDVATNIAFAEHKRDLERLRANKRGVFSLGGPGPVGTVIQPARNFNRSNDDKQEEDVSMKEQPAVEFEPAERFVEDGWEEYKAERDLGHRAPFVESDY